jgi:hypothetical protein
VFPCPLDFFNRQGVFDVDCDSPSVGLALNLAVQIDQLRQFAGLSPVSSNRGPALRFVWTKVSPEFGIDLKKVVCWNTTYSAVVVHVLPLLPLLLPCINSIVPCRY